MELGQRLADMREERRHELLLVDVEEAAIGGGTSVGHRVGEVGIDLQEAVAQRQSDGGCRRSLIGHWQRECLHGLPHGEQDVAARVAESAVEVEDDEPDVFHTHALLLAG